MTKSGLCGAAAGVALVLGLTWAARADEPDARQVLERAQAALKGVHAVDYDAEGRATGYLARQLPPMSGKVTIAPATSGEVPRFRLDAAIQPDGASSPLRAEMANDGETVTVIDHAQRVFVESKLPGGARYLNNASPLLMRELTAPVPLERELRAKLTYEGTQTVAGESCDVIHAVYAEDGGGSRWYIARTDMLPRRVDRIVNTTAGEATITTTLTRLQVNPALDVAAFKLAKPEGYSSSEARELAQQMRSGRFLAPGTAAPDFTLKNGDGNDVSLSSLKGKVVLLDFWATWCGPCRKAMPSVQKLHEKYAGKPVAVYGVNCWEKRPDSDPLGFVKQQGLTYPQLIKGDQVALSYKVRGIPTFYVISPEGQILYADSGISEATEQRIDETIQTALGALSAGKPSTPTAAQNSD